jgi:hypothetical protein
LAAVLGRSRSVVSARSGRGVGLSRPASRVDNRRG